jgi:hypothetical protein
VEYISVCGIRLRIIEKIIHDLHDFIDWRIFSNQPQADPAKPPLEKPKLR